MPSRRDDGQLIEYLNRLRAALEGLPASEREDAYRELAQHVESLVNEAVLTGEEGGRAVRAALQRFGEPEKIGQKIVSDYWAQAFRQIQPKRVRKPWLEGSIPLLPGLIAGGAVIVLIHFHSCLAAVVSVSVTVGPLMGIIGGWQRAQARKRIWAEDEFEVKRNGEPTVPHRKLPRLMAPETPPLILACLVGLIISLHLPATNGNKWSFVFYCVMFLGALITADVSQRFFLLRDSGQDIDTGGKKSTP